MSSTPVAVIRRLLKSPQGEERVAGVMLLTASASKVGYPELGLSTSGSAADTVNESFETIEALINESYELLKPDFVMRMLHTEGKVHHAAVDYLQLAMRPHIVSLYRPHTQVLLDLCYGSSSSSLLSVLKVIALASDRYIALKIAYNILQSAVNNQVLEPIVVLEVFTEIAIMFHVPEEYGNFNFMSIGDDIRGSTTGVDMEGERDMDKWFAGCAEPLRTTLVQCLHGGASETVRDRTLIVLLALFRCTTDEMLPFTVAEEDIEKNNNDNNVSARKSILTLWWSVESSNDPGAFVTLLISVVKGELHLLFEESLGLFGNLEDGNLEDESRDHAQQKQMKAKERALRLISMLWTTLSVVDQSLILLVGTSKTSSEAEGVGSGGVWSDLAGEYLTKLHELFSGLVGEMISFVKEVSYLKRSLGVVPQMLSNIVCRISRTLTSLALEDQQYFQLLLANLDHFLDSSRISIENLPQLVSSANIDEATVSDTAAILCGKTLFKKYLIVPGSHSVYRDTSVTAVVTASASSASAVKSPVKPGATLKTAWGEGGGGIRGGGGGGNSSSNATGGGGLHLREGFNLTFRRIADSTNSDYNWLCGQGDVLQHLLPCMVALSGTLLSDMGFEDGVEHREENLNVDNHRYGKLLLTQLCASRGYCCRLLSSILVACAYINTQALVEPTPEAMAAHAAATASAMFDEAGVDESSVASGNNQHPYHEEADTSDDVLHRLKEIDEFSRVCGTASMAAEQLNVLLEFSMGSDNGPQDQKLMEAVRPELLKDIKDMKEQELPDSFKPRHDPTAMTTVCSMPPTVWTNLFRNLRVLTASLRSKVKPITFHNDKAASVATLLFSLDEMDSTVACLQPLLSL